MESSLNHFQTLEIWKDCHMILFLFMLVKVFELAFVWYRSIPSSAQTNYLRRRNALILSWLEEYSLDRLSLFRPRGTKFTKKEPYGVFFKCFLDSLNLKSLSRFPSPRRENKSMGRISLLYVLFKLQKYEKPIEHTFCPSSTKIHEKETIEYFFLLFDTC